MDCIFCKIINGEIPSYKVYEDETVLAFLDINPASNGHTLIIPKNHFVDSMDIDSDTVMHIFKVGLKVKKLLEEKLKCTGITFSQNNGDVEEVKHFHLHVVPHYENNVEIKNPSEIYDIIKGD